MFSRAAPVLTVAALCSMSWACGKKAPPRMDDLSPLAGRYERAIKDILGEVTKGTLEVEPARMRFQDGTLRDELVFDEIVCETPTRCRIKGAFCAATLEKKDDGTLVVEAEARCEKMGGLWYPFGQAPHLLPASAFVPTTSASAVSSIPTLDCLRACKETTRACVRSCNEDASCPKACDEQGFLCSMSRCGTPQ